MDTDKLALAAAAACGKIRIWGGDGEREDNPDQNDQDVEQQDQDQSDDSDESDDQDSQEQPDEDDDDDADSDELTSAKKENIKLKKRIANLEKSKEDSDNDRNAAKERDKLKIKNDKLQNLLNTKFLEWNISQDKRPWIDIEDVRKAIDLEAISIDIEAGTVEGLDLELKRIAKKKPHWIKQAKEDGDSQGPSGGHPNGSTKQKELDERKIAEKYKIPGYGTHLTRAL